MQTETEKPSEKHPLQLSAQEAYEAMQSLALAIERTEEAVKPVFQRGNYCYSPFDYLSSQFSRSLCEARKKLIEKRSEEMRKQHIPQIFPEKAQFLGFEGYEKLMDNAVGRDNYDEQVLIKFFRSFSEDVERVEYESFKQVLDRAQYLLPWINCEKSHDVNAVYDGNRTLKLQCYTWNGGYLSSGLNQDGKWEAFEKVIRMAIHNEKAAEDPSTYQPILKHVVHAHAGETELFFKHQEPERTNYPVESFQFYKNGHVYVKFRNRTFAMLVAKMLVLGQRQGQTVLGAPEL